MALREGSIQFLQAYDGVLEYTRSCPGQTLRVCVNHSNETREFPGGNVILDSAVSHAGKESILVEPMGFCILEDK